MPTGSGTGTLPSWRSAYSKAKAAAQSAYKKVVSDVKTSAAGIKKTYAETKVYVTDKVTDAKGALKQSRQNKLNASFDKITSMTDSLNAIKSQQAKRQLYLNYAQYSRNPFVKLKGWFISRKFNKTARRENMLSAKLAYEESRNQVLAEKFKKKYGNEMGYVGRKSSKSMFFDFNKSPETEQKERDAHREKNKNYDSYMGKKSNLDPAEIYSSDGKYMGHYKHFNSIDNSVEIDLSSPYQSGRFTSKGLSITTYNKVELKLNENHELDLSLPENRGFVDNPKILKDILKEHPEAYKTLPSQYFDNTMGGQLNRSDVLDMVREGVKDKVATAQRSPDGEYYTNVPAMDENGNYLGRSATTKEFMERTFNDIIEKDKELHSYTEQNSATYRARQAQMKARANAAKHYGQTKDVDEFFDKAK